ncbi:MAG: aminodeoxychorismate/anthranilate synthase component II [Polyangiaceae bacterium]|nr:aminodeoxychorismate/anthranilate synthase component II [Polyangiaceae bacterium]
MSRPVPIAMHVLFLENEDSFSWNVVDRLPVGREAVTIASGRTVARAPERLRACDAVVVGPGPTDPVRAGLVELVRFAAAEQKPLLGICLGHQAIGLAFGARLVRSTPCHGKTARADFQPSRFFAAFRGPHTVMRYHSLSLAEVVAPLHIVAATEDGIPMAIEHATLPIAGLQFHPDSYATPEGERMLASFFEALS